MTLRVSAAPVAAGSKAGLPAAVTSNGRSTQNRLPLFSVLSKPMRPPIASVRPFAIVVPSPVPP